MSYRTIIYDVRDSIGYVTLNRPEVMNGINARMTHEIVEVCQRVRADPEVRVMILTGAGERGFCMGLDLRERAAESAGATLVDKRRDRRVPGIVLHHQAVASVDKPVIAAVRGWAVGGGLEIALACDIRVASDDARLGMLEVRRGRLGGAGGTQRLSRLVGTGKAFEMCLTGEAIDAAEAYRVGLVNPVVPPLELLPAAEEIARKITLGDPLSVMAIKESIKKGVDLPVDQGLLLECDLGSLLSTTEDRREGSRAFAEKRAPVWQGR